MKEVKLPSGAVLKMMNTPFAESKALYQVIMKEAKNLELTKGRDLGDLMKDILCYAFSSKEVDAALEICMKRCTYNDKKIDASTFESAEAREDYSIVCIEVMQENVSPFLKGLFAGFKTGLSILTSVQA